MSKVRRACVATYCHRVLSDFSLYDAGFGFAAGSKFSIKGTFLEGRGIYLDMQATTPMDPRVVDAMLPYMTELYGNPHSRTHHYGWESEAAVEKAREVIL